MERSVDGASQQGGKGALFQLGAHEQSVKLIGRTSAVEAVPVLSLRPADSPRLNGEDKAHIARLVETETPLPPILVDSRTMRVRDRRNAPPDGRVLCRDGRPSTSYFSRGPSPTFSCARSRRTSPTGCRCRRPTAAPRQNGSSCRTRICPTALSATRSAWRRRPWRRSGRNLKRGHRRSRARGSAGTVRSGRWTAGRAGRRAAELLAQQPDASLRDVARAAAGISPATVLDVRKRLESAASRRCRRGRPRPVRAR